MDMTRNFAAQLLIGIVFTLMLFIKTGQPVSKQANWFVNQQPINSLGSEFSSKGHFHTLQLFKHTPGMPKLANIDEGHFLLSPAL